VVLKAKALAVLVVCLVAVLLLPLPVNLVPAAGVVGSLVVLRRASRRR